MIFEFSHASLSVTASVFVSTVMSSDQAPRVLNLSSLGYFIMSDPGEYKMIMQQRTPNQIPR